MTRFWSEDKQKDKPPEANGPPNEFLPGEAELAALRKIKAKLGR